MAGSTSVIGRSEEDMSAAETTRTATYSINTSGGRRVPKMRGFENGRRANQGTKPNLLFTSTFGSKHSSWPTLSLVSSRSFSYPSQPRALRPRSSSRMPPPHRVSLSLQSCSNFQASKKHVPSLPPLSSAVLTLSEISLPPASNTRRFCLCCNSFHIARSGTI